MDKLFKGRTKYLHIGRKDLYEFEGFLYSRAVN